MGPDQTTPRRQSHRRAARAAADIVTLPAVATLDWCESAALALTRLASPSIVAVLIATTDERGAMRRVEASGVAGRAAPFQQTGPALGAPADDALEPLPPEDPRLTGVRSRIERLQRLGYEPAGALRPTSARLADLPGGARWRETDAGKPWKDIEPQDLLLAAAPLGSDEPGRGIFAYLAVAESASETGVLDALDAVLPLLADRALMAIGPRTTTAGRWLTVREQLVLEQLILGKTVRNIAEDLDRSPHTVHDHVKSLHRKLAASSRGELIARALGHVTDHAATDARPAQTVEAKTSRAPDVTIGSQAAPHKPRLVGSDED